MCKEGCCVGLGQEGVTRGWGNCLKYLDGMEQKRGEKKILKSGGQAGSRVGCLKKGSRLEPLTNYDFWLT